MKAEFWHDSWKVGGTKTSFHRRDIHPFVVEYCPPEFLAGKRVLVPLCGKTNAMSWFQEHAEHTIGVELVETAVSQYFDEHPQPYQKVGNRYEADKLTFLNADLFNLTNEEVGTIDLIYDRASLIAFPYDMRMTYLQKMNSLSHIGTKIMLITLEYFPTMDEPPFSVNAHDVNTYYSDSYAIEHFENAHRPGHGMERKYGLEYVIEHGFWLTKEK